MLSYRILPNILIWTPVFCEQFVHFLPWVSEYSPSIFYNYPFPLILVSDFIFWSEVVDSFEIKRCRHFYPNYCHFIPQVSLLLLSNNIIELVKYFLFCSLSGQFHIKLALHIKKKIKLLKNIFNDEISYVVIDFR